MSDTQAAMREFRFLDETRKTNGLTPAEEQRWYELAQGLGVDIGQAHPPAQQQGYFAEDGNWYPYPEGYDPVTGQYAALAPVVEEQFGGYAQQPPGLSQPQQWYPPQQQQPQGYYAEDGNWYPYPPGYDPQTGQYYQGYAPQQPAYPPQAAQWAAPPPAPGWSAPQQQHQPPIFDPATGQWAYPGYAPVPEPSDPAPQHQTWSAQVEPAGEQSLPVSELSYAEAPAEQSMRGPPNQAPAPNDEGPLEVSSDDVMEVADEEVVPVPSSPVSDTTSSPSRTGAEQLASLRTALSFDDDLAAAPKSGVFGVPTSDGTKAGAITSFQQAPEEEARPGPIHQLVAPAAVSAPAQASQVPELATDEFGSLDDAAPLTQMTPPLDTGVPAEARFKAVLADELPTRVGPIEPRSSVAEVASAKAAMAKALLAKAAEAEEVGEAPTRVYPASRKTPAPSKSELPMVSKSSGNSGFFKPTAPAGVEPLVAVKPELEARQDISPSALGSTDFGASADTSQRQAVSTDFAPTLGGPESAFGSTDSGLAADAPTGRTEVGLGPVSTSDSGQRSTGAGALKTLPGSTGFGTPPPTRAVGIEPALVTEAVDSATAEQHGVFSEQAPAARTPAYEPASAQKGLWPALDPRKAATTVLPAFVQPQPATQVAPAYQPEALGESSPVAPTGAFEVSVVTGAERPLDELPATDAQASHSLLDTDPELGHVSRALRASLEAAPLSPSASLDDVSALTQHVSRPVLEPAPSPLAPLPLTVMKPFPALDALAISPEVPIEPDLPLLDGIMASPPSLSPALLMPAPAVDVSGLASLGIPLAGASRTSGLRSSGSGVKSSPSGFADWSSVPIVESPPDSFEAQSAPALLDDAPIPIEAPIDLSGNADDRPDLVDPAYFLEPPAIAAQVELGSVAEPDTGAFEVDSSSLASMANDVTGPPGLGLGSSADDKLELASNADFLSVPALTSTGEGWASTRASVPLGDPGAEDDSEIIQGVVLEDDLVLQASVPQPLSPQLSWDAGPTRPSPPPMQFGKAPPAPAAPSIPLSAIAALPTPIPAAPPQPAVAYAPLQTRVATPIVAPGVPVPASPPGDPFDRSGLSLGGAEPVQILVEGEHRVIVHTVEGQVKRGVIRDANLGADIVTLEGSSVENLPRARVKAVFFMLAPGARAPIAEGEKIRVTFKDGRQVAGFSKDQRNAAMGFFVVPADNRTNTERIFIYRHAVQTVTFE